MASKALLVLGILIAALLIISEVTAREMAEKAKTGQTRDAVEYHQYAGHEGVEVAVTDEQRERCCCQGSGWQCKWCCNHKGERIEAMTETELP